MLNMFILYKLKVISAIFDPIPASVLPLKAVVSYISHNIESNISAKRCGSYTSIYGNPIISLLCIITSNKYFTSN